MHKFLFLLFIAACCVYCQQPAPGAMTAQTESATTNIGQIPAGFMDFYKQFHADKAYQLAHISWPLSGLRSQQIDSTSTKTIDTEWTKDEWAFQQLDMIESSNDYVRDFQSLGDNLVIEHIRTKMAGFGMERRFARIGSGEWELIYYADMHEVK